MLSANQKLKDDIVSILVKVDNDDRRITRLEALEMFYLKALVEDPIDGTFFDCRVLDAIEDLKRGLDGCVHG